MTDFANAVEEPIDLLLLSLKEKVYVKLRHGRELKGKLVAYDEHLNLMMSDAEEKITTTDIDPLTKQESLKIQKKNHALIFVRGDLVIVVSPTPQQ